MSQKALSALTGLIVLLCSSVCYSSWTTPVLVTGSVPPNASGAYDVTPNSEAAQRVVLHMGTQARVLFNRNQTTLRGSYPYIDEALSTNGGSTWTSWSTVYSGLNNLSQFSPSLVLVNGVLHGTWYQYNSTAWGDIFYARSTDFGTSWTVRQPPWYNQLDMNMGCKEFPHLAVSTNGQQVIIGWTFQYTTPFHMKEVYSADGGLNWSAVTDINPNDHIYLANLTYSSSGRFIAVYSKQDASYTAQIYSTFTTDGGVHWSTAIPVFTQTSYQDYPAVAANGNIVVCVWQDLQTLYSATSTDCGTSWGNLHTFDSNYPINDYPISEWPSLAYDPCSGNFLCAWASQKNGGSQPEVYVSENATPGASNWPTPTQVSTNVNGNPSHGPRVSVYPNNLGGRTRFITFSNGSSLDNMSVWESQSGCIPSIQEGGGQSKGVVQRPDVEAPMVRAVPNPASRFVTLSYSLGEGIARRTLRVYSATGRLVKVIDLEASMRDFRWDLKDERGVPVPNGVYYLRLEGAEGSFSGKLIVLR